MCIDKQNKRIYAYIIHTNIGKIISVFIRLLAFPIFSVSQSTGFTPSIVSTIKPKEPPKHTKQNP